VSNGSIELNARQLQTLSQFENLNICLSIDGVGDQFNYIRWPLKWDKLQYNLVQFKKITQHISVSCMISNLNIMYYTDLVDFFKSNQLKYLCKQIVNPAHFAPGNLSDEFKQQVLENNKRYHKEVSAFLGYGGGLLKKFWEEIDRQDQLKGTNIKDYLPELAATRI
jgi:sulfatase maturation enzyme AslB (radical SAM superfamily)